MSNNWGAQSFLGSLQGLAETLFRQSAMIASLRINTATQKAQAELGMQEAKFLAAIDAYQITPDNFEDKFQEFQSSLDDYSAGISFAPARERVKSLAQGLLPKTYTTAAAAMNRQQLAQNQGDFNAAIETFVQTPGLSAEDRRDKIQAVIDDQRARGGMNPVLLDDAERVNASRFAFDSTLEAARARGSVSAGLAALSDPKAKGFEAVPMNIRQAVTGQLQKELETNGKAFKASFEGYLTEAQDRLIATPEELELKIDRADVADSVKAEARASLVKHQDDALFSIYLQELNNAKGNVSRLETLKKDLKTEGAWDIYPEGSKLEHWVGPAQEKRRQDLLEKLDSEIKDASDPDKLAAGGRERIGSIVELFRRQDPVDRNGYRNANGKAMTWGQAMAAVDFEAAAGGDKTAEAAEQARKELRSILPVGADASIDALGAMIKSSKLAEKDPTRAAWAYNEFDNRAKQKPNATSADMTTWVREITGVYTAKELDLLRGEEALKSGILGNDIEKKMLAVGSLLQSGKADAAINRDTMTGRPSYAPGLQAVPEQAYSFYQKKALNEYGVQGTPEVQADGSFLLRGEAGQSWKWVIDEKKGAELFTYDEGKGKVDRPLKPSQPQAPSKAAVQQTKAKADAIEDLGLTANAAARLKKIALAVRSNLLTRDEIESAGYNPDTGEKKR